MTKIVLKPQILRNKRRDFASTCESRLNLTASLPEAADPFCAVDYLPDNNQVDREDDESHQKTDREHYSVLLEIGQCDESDEKSKKDVALAESGAYRSLALSIMTAMPTTRLVARLGRGGAARMRLPSQVILFG